MRGSIAEDQGTRSGARGESTARSGAGYKLRPSEENGRSAMVGRRGSNQGWELRLGKLQVAVWLGLAVGSIVGSYSVGFFAGRYVGFETARKSTSVEVAKLPITDIAPELPAQNPSTIYEKLNSPAVMREVEQEAAVSKPRVAAKESAPAYKEPKIIDEDAAALAAGTSEKRSQAAAQDGGAAAPAAAVEEIEELFGEDGTGSELIIGDEQSAPTKKVPESVRILGAEKAVEPAQVEKSANELLDERIASARTTEEKAPKVEKKPAASDPLVRKVLPPGFFAQVAAPKKQSDAESIARKLKQSGFPVVIESTTVRGESFYRVLVGPEENKVQADRLVSQLRSESYIAGAPFIRKVK